MDDTHYHDRRKEINPAAETTALGVLHPAGFPKLPGGWIQREYNIGGRPLKLMVPFQPDALLDDPTVLAANAIDDYMPYWAYLWPAAIKMSTSVLLSDWPSQTRVLELGSGLGLVGIAALAAGYQVTLTDYDLMAVDVARRNAELNGFSRVDAIPLDWRNANTITYPVILGCDVTYEQRNHAPILDLLDRTLEADGVCWLADGGRAASTEFWNLAKQRRFRISVFGVDGNLISAPRLEYQLFELRRED